MARVRKPIVLDRPSRGRINDIIAETICDTPLARIPTITAVDGISADICLKLEFVNLIASMKDRIGLNIILAAEADGRLKPGGTIIEPRFGITIREDAGPRGPRGPERRPTAATPRFLRDARVRKIDPNSFHIKTLLSRLRY